jgi:sigma-E factor negative regulatory protein RseB
MLRCIITLCIVSVSWFASAESEVKQNASPTAQSFYEDMLKRAPNAMYEGIFIHQAGNQTQSVEIVHGTHEGVIWERLLHLDGLTREVIRRGEALYCIHPNQTVEQVQQQGSSPFAKTELGSIRQLAKAYEFRNLGKQRVAGRMVEGVQLAPKDASRHFYQLWLDLKPWCRYEPNWYHVRAKCWSAINLVILHLSLSSLKSVLSRALKVPY